MTCWFIALFKIIIYNLWLKSHVVRVVEQSLNKLCINRENKFVFIFHDCKMYVCRRRLHARPLRLNRESIAVRSIGASGPTSAPVLESTSSENIYLSGNEPLLPRTPTNSSSEDASGLGCAEGEAIPLHIVRRPNTLKKKETEEVWTDGHWSQSKFWVIDK